jgi:hypothetical protein
MGWETYTAIVIIGNIFALIKISEIMQPNERDAIQSTIVNGLKTFFIGAALVLSAVSIGAANHVIDLSTNTTNTTAMTNVKTTINTVYSGALFIYIPFVFFLFIMIIIIGINELKKAKMRR